MPNAYCSGPGWESGACVHLSPRDIDTGIWIARKRSVTRRRTRAVTGVGKRSHRDRFARRWVTTSPKSSHGNARNKQRYGSTQEPHWSAFPRRWRLRATLASDYKRNVARHQLASSSRDVGRSINTTTTSPTLYSTFATTCLRPPPDRQSFFRYTSIPVLARGILSLKRDTPALSRHGSSLILPASKLTLRSSSW